MIGDKRFLSSVLIPKTSSVSQGTVSLSQSFARSYNSLQNQFNFDMTDTITTNGLASTLNYSSANLTYTQNSPLGRSQKVQIDNQSRPLQISNGSLTPVQNQYDSRGRLTTITQGDRVTQVTYGANGQISTLIDPMGRQTLFDYDLNLRLIKQTLPGNRVLAMDYDANDNLISIAPPGKSAHTNQFNQIDLITQYLPPQLANTQTPTNYVYNLDQQLTQSARSDGKNINLIYDNVKGFLTQIQTPDGSYNFSYANNGQLTQQTSPYGVSSSFGYMGNLLASSTQTLPIGAVASINYSYNNFFNPLSINVMGNIVNFTYDNDQLLQAAGNLNLNFDLNSLLTSKSQGAVQQTMGYNSFGEMVSLSAQSGTSVVYSMNLTRDKLSRITQKVENILGAGNVTYAYSYDLAGRLYQVRRDGVLVGQYLYDQNGNRTSAQVEGSPYSATYDSQDRLKSYGTKTYSYNLNGDLESITDNATGVVKSLSYDVYGNLKSFSDGVTSITYLADASNRRVGKKVNGALTQGFVYQSQTQVAAELNANGTLKNRFVYASESHSPDYMISSTGATYHFIKDQVGSIRLVVNSGNGDVVQRIDYDEFGKVKSDNNPGFQPFGFAGGLYDRDSGLVRFGARDYDPEMGRWTTKDSSLFDSGSSNLYVYSENDAINNIDSNGEFLVPAVVAAGVFFYTSYLDTPGQGGRENELIGTIVGSLAGYTQGYLNKGSCSNNAEQVLKHISNNKKLSKQFIDRGISEAAIRRALLTKGIPTQGKMNPATRYIDPISGQSVTIDNVTGQPFQIAPAHYKFGGSK